MPIQPQHTYVHLAENGNASEVLADSFWSQPEMAAQYEQGWLVSEFAFDKDWSNWEMHPHGDEVVYLLSGALDLHIEEAGQLRIVAIDGSGAVVVPRGLWHTAKVRAPSRMLHVTRGKETQHRPV